MNTEAKAWFVWVSRNIWSYDCMAISPFEIPFCLFQIEEASPKTPQMFLKLIRVNYLQLKKRQSGRNVTETYFCFTIALSLASRNSNGKSLKLLLMHKKQRLLHFLHAIDNNCCSSARSKSSFQNCAIKMPSDQMT